MWQRIDRERSPQDPRMAVPTLIGGGNKLSSIGLSIIQETIFT